MINPLYFKLVFLLLFTLSTPTVSYAQLPTKGLCAHRGAMDTHPENTLPAFQAAIDAGAHMIEFDVWLTSDGQMVVIHDATVDRTTDGSGKVANLSLEEIKKLDAGSWKAPEFSGVRIPTLEETLSILPYNIWLNIHIKAEGKLPLMIAKTIKEKNRMHQSFLACSESAASAVKEVYPEMRWCNMDRRNTTEKYVDQTIRHNADFLQFPKTGPAITAQHIEKLKSHGVSINYYKADTIEEVNKLLQMGVDFPLVNNIVEYMQHANEFGLRSVEPLFSHE
ncbi:glycerophosphoryl diester phosphodiesterase [Catalinimonas alkaloidigena]|uniref:glycerophosphodiester phosphodiesterase n=1 Tax=Catalinimonas alkaloidigena TaxID=1075417 RepID=UPI002404E8BD|nr:glycerophosphodiester phosphodiesterase family protein [Catalinimonas alkaloidigena]MDF9797792.1 glycerophosphoryl diester phosphodiesterase [Catalinimonas alkaloidigena]